MNVAKRDSMGYALDPPLIIFLVMVAAGVLILCMRAVHRLLYDSDDEDANTGFVYHPRSDDQEAYMHEVRTRTKRDLIATARANMLADIQRTREQRWASSNYHYRGMWGRGSYSSGTTLSYQNDYC